MPQIGAPCERPNGGTVCPRMPAVVRLVKWALALAGGALWALHRLVHTSLFYDEWTLVGQTLHRRPWGAAVASFNGHLWLFQDLLYRAQVHWFGVDQHWLVVGAFVVVLMALHVAVTRLALAAGLPLGVALVVGLVVTYLGRGAQDHVFAVQVSPMAAVALSVWACRSVVVEEPTRRATALVGVGALLAVVTESGAGGIGLVMVAVLVVALWGRRHLVVLVPAAAVVTAWLLFADGGPTFPSGRALQLRWFLSLLLHGAGSLVGGRAAAGLTVLLAGGLTALWLGRVGAWRRTDAALACAGVAGAIASAAAVARTRAGLPGLELVGSNRYVHGVAVPMAVAAVGVIAAVSHRVRRPTAVTWATLAVLVMGIIVSTPAGSAYSRGFVESNRVVRDGVRAAAVLISIGCPSGVAPDPSARPVGAASPQVTVELVSQLMARGHLHVDPAWRVPDEVLHTVCPG